MANSNIKQIQSRQVVEDQSHQVSRQRNQAQRSCSETYEEVRVRLCKVY
jgi:hypothetical protein